MLIYSQDGHTMYSSLHVVMIDWETLKLGPCVVSVTMTDQNIYTLGEYSTIERARDAFYDLRQALVHSDPYFMMPADIGAVALDAIREMGQDDYDQRRKMGKELGV